MKNLLIFLFGIILLSSCDISQKSDSPPAVKTFQIRYETQSTGVYEVGWYDHIWNKNYIKDNFVFTFQATPGDTLQLGAYSVAKEVNMFISVDGQVVETKIVPLGGYGLLVHYLK